MKNFDPFVKFINFILEPTWANTWWGKIIRVPMMVPLFCILLIGGIALMIFEFGKWFWNIINAIFIKDWEF